MASILKPVSIVIPIKNRGNLLPNLIKNLLNLNYPQYEIIIVDDCSTDNTKDLLLKYPIKSISLKTSVGSAKARNIGIKNAKNDIIALTDSDCFVSKNWLKNLVPFLDKYDIVGGRVVFNDSAEMKMNPFNQKKKIVIKKESSMNFLNTSNMIFNKYVWNSTGGFISYRIEDLEFSWRCLRKGFRLIYVPKGLVIHHGKRSLFQNIKKYLQYGKSYSKIVAIYHMDFIFKTEPYTGKKSVKDYLPLIICSNFISFALFICSFIFFNRIYNFSLFNFSLFFLIYFNFLFLKKNNIIYILYKLSIMFSIMVYTLIYLVKRKLISDKN